MKFAHCRSGDRKLVYSGKFRLTSIHEGCHCTQIPERLVARCGLPPIPVLTLHKYPPNNRQFAPRARIFTYSAATLTPSEFK